MALWGISNLKRISLKWFYQFIKRHFCLVCGYYVSTVGHNKQTVQNYIQNQEKEDMICNQVSLVEYYDPFAEWLDQYTKQRRNKKNK